MGDDQPYVLLVNLFSRLKKYKNNHYFFMDGSRYFFLVGYARTRIISISHCIAHHVT
nr:hypothetical protein [Candidatus Coxiella mudrowiae]